MERLSEKGLSPELSTSLVIVDLPVPGKLSEHLSWLFLDHRLLEYTAVRSICAVCSSDDDPGSRVLLQPGKKRYVR